MTPDSICRANMRVVLVGDDQVRAAGDTRLGEPLMVMSANSLEPSVSDAERAGLLQQVRQIDPELAPRPRAPASVVSGHGAKGGPPGFTLGLLRGGVRRGHRRPVGIPDGRRGPASISQAPRPCPCRRRGSPGVEASTRTTGPVSVLPPVPGGPGPAVALTWRVNGASSPDGDRAPLPGDAELHGSALAPQAVGLEPLRRSSRWPGSSRRSR